MLSAAQSDRQVPESCVEQAEFCPDNASEEDFMKCLSQDPDCQSGLEAWHSEKPVIPTEPVKVLETISSEAPSPQLEAQGPGVFHYALMFVVGAGCCAMLIALYFLKFANRKKKGSAAKPHSPILLKTFKESQPKSAMPIP